MTGWGCEGGCAKGDYLSHHMTHPLESRRFAHVEGRTEQNRTEQNRTVIHIEFRLRESGAKDRLCMHVKIVTRKEKLKWIIIRKKYIQDSTREKKK